MKSPSLLFIISGLGLTYLVCCEVSEIVGRLKLGEWMKTKSSQEVGQEISRLNVLAASTSREAALSEWSSTILQENLAERRELVARRAAVGIGLNC